MALDEFSSADDILMGSFTTFQGAASQGLSATNMWSALRQSANSWAQSVLSGGRQGAPTDEQVQAKANALLAHVRITDVNRYAQIIGQWQKARNNITSKDPLEQITAGDIFTPPWSKTSGNPAIPQSYTLRVEWDRRDLIGHKAYERVWKSYTITGPLTNVQDLLARAERAFKESESWSRYRVRGITNFELTAN